MKWTTLVVATAAGFVAVVPQGTKPGSPEDHLPPNITRMTYFPYFLPTM